MTLEEAILKRLFRLYGIAELPEGIAPMTVSWLGNSSVATMPTLLELVRRSRRIPFREPRDSDHQAK